MLDVVGVLEGCGIVDGYGMLAGFRIQCNMFDAKDQLRVIAYGYGQT